MSAGVDRGDTDEFLLDEEWVGKHFGPRPHPVVATFGAMSHAGRVRTNNEDHYLVVERRRIRTVLSSNLPAGALAPADDVAYLLAVADGMGGEAFGELASMLALQSGWEQAPHAMKWTWIITDREIADLRDRVDVVFARIEQALQQRAQADPQCAGMGTTLTGIYTVGTEAFIAHVGDSRAYLFRQRKLAQLTRDHTLAQAAMDLGVPVLSHSWYHALTNCLGAADRPAQAEFHHLHLSDGDHLLVCSDGLSDMVPDEQITAILAQPSTAHDKANALVQQALDNGGKDNVTVIVARYLLQT